MAQPDLRQYERAINLLRMVSEGTYSGPVVSSSEMEKVASSTEGLNTKILREAAAESVGKTNFSVKNKLWSVLFNVVKQCAMTLIASGLMDLASTWLGGLIGAKNLAKEANHAGDAIDDVDAHANKTIATVLSQLTVAIEKLSGHIAAIDKKEDPHGFLHCVQAGADCIDSAAKVIAITCTDRDKAIESCYAQLGASLSKECGRQDTREASGVAKGQAITVIAQAECALAGATAAAEECTQESTTPQSFVRQKNVEKEQALDVVTPAPHPDRGEKHEGMCGVLGALGVGVSLIGLSLLVGAACEWLNSIPGCEETEEAAAPARPEEPVPEPTPQPRSEEPKVSKVPLPVAEEPRGVDKQQFIAKQQECVPQGNKGVGVKKAGAW
ncbi:hypothetical protein [Corynebacterium ulcerans]|uniref:hypothetical protein n=1 Tax=Corynebacterium ulcerans TaxID=65058 RepID=UPI00051F656C|nr:hypothetical protein [Corynebacterium ulcerans]AIT88442.1 Hypothetical protein Cul210932_0478 [Corynebacterium ulcerans]ALD94210.1 Hypothetical protein Cul131001_0484 [Corynebacterium ulcerans]SQG57641.1 Uncharacterised protein [Corynebacterium ulcerans]